MNGPALSGNGLRLVRPDDEPAPREVELRRVLNHSRRRQSEAATGRQRDAWRVFAAHCEAMIKELEK